MNCATHETWPLAATGSAPFWSLTEFARLSDPQQTLLILDKGGNIQFCSAPRLLGCDGTHMQRCHIRQVIPEMAMRRSTPGYNLAYVTFWFGENVWRPFRALAPDGRSLDVEVNLQASLIDGRHWLLAHVRRVTAVSKALMRPAMAFAA